MAKRRKKTLIEKAEDIVDKAEDSSDEATVNRLLLFFCIIGWVGLPLIFIYELLDTQFWVFIVGISLVTLSLIPNLFTCIMTIKEKN